MSTISTHVLDTSLGRPAAGIRVTLERVSDGAARMIGHGATDADGRVRELLPKGEQLEPGDYRLRFETAEYFSAAGRDAFYPHVTVDFRVWEGTAHYHVPLLLSPFGYSTYRGS